MDDLLLWLFYTLLLMGSVLLLGGISWLIERGAEVIDEWGQGNE